MKITIDLDENILERIKEVSKKLNLHDDEIIKKIIEATLLSGCLELFHDKIEKDEKPSKFLERIIYLSYDYGKTLDSFLRSADEWFGGLYRNKFILENMGLVENYHGIWFNFTASRFTKIPIDEILLQLQNNNDAYIKYSTFIEIDDPNENFLEIASKRIKKFENESIKIEEELGSCSDFYEVNVKADYFDSDSITVDVNLYFSQWECIPKLGVIGRYFAKIKSCIEKSKQ